MSSSFNISSGFKDVKKLNKETQVSREIETALNKRLDVKGKGFEFSLTDIIIGMGSAGVGFKTAGTVLVAKKIYQSPQFRTRLAQFLKNLSEQEKIKILDALKKRDIAIMGAIMTPVLSEFQE